MEMLLTGEPIDAERASAVGLVNRVVDEGGALEAAVELASEIAGNGPLAVAATKQIVLSAPNWSPTEGWARQDEIIRPVFASEDAREGSIAFAERRAPVWQGR
jgi:enoyl-CoA hydratase